MYSFAQRNDTTVYDEPLYAHYLTVTGREHPGAAEVIASQPSDGNVAIEQTVFADVDTPVYFMKQMAHHLIGLDRAFLGRTRNVLLVRDPDHMYRSLAVQLPDATLADSGLELQVELLDDIIAAGDQPIVIDAQVIRNTPEPALRALCDAVGIDFDPAMLHWPAGPRPEDGVWAKHWYHNLHTTTGFEPYGPVTRELPESMRPILDQAMPLYERLGEFALEI